MASDAALAALSQVGEAPEAATTPDVPGGGAKAAAKSPKAGRATPKARKPAAKAAAKSPAAAKAAKGPNKAGIAKKAATPKAKKGAHKAEPSSPVAKKAAGAKPKAVWAANPLAFTTGADDRAARAKAHRRGRT